MISEGKHEDLRRRYILLEATIYSALESFNDLKSFFHNGDVVIEHIDVIINSINMKINSIIKGYPYEMECHQCCTKWKNGGKK